MDEMTYLEQSIPAIILHAANCVIAMEGVQTRQINNRLMFSHIY